MAHAPAAIAAQLQVAVALVGALHQQCDGLGLHVGCAARSAELRDACQAASLPPVVSATIVHVSGARAPASGAFYRHPRPDFADRLFCGCRLLADSEATAPTWPNQRPDTRAGGRAEHVGAADATRRGCVTRVAAAAREPGVGGLQPWLCTLRPAGPLGPEAAGCALARVLKAPREGHPGPLRFGSPCKLFPHKAAPRPFWSQASRLISLSSFPTRDVRPCSQPYREASHLSPSLSSKYGCADPVRESTWKRKEEAAPPHPTHTS